MPECSRSSRMVRGGPSHPSPGASDQRHRHPRPISVSTALRDTQDEVARDDRQRGKWRPTQHATRGTQVPPRRPRFPEEHQSKPGKEAKLDPEPMYDAPFWKGSGSSRERSLFYRRRLRDRGARWRYVLARGAARRRRLRISRRTPMPRLPRRRSEPRDGVQSSSAGDVPGRDLLREAVLGDLRELGGIDLLVQQRGVQMHTEVFLDLCPEHSRRDREDEPLWLLPLAHASRREKGCLRRGPRSSIRVGSPASTVPRSSSTIR